MTHEAREPDRRPWGEGASLQAWSALGLGCLAIWAGLIQTGMDREFLPRLEFPLVAASMGLPPIALGVMAISASKKGPPSEFLLRHAGSLSLLFLAATFVAQVLLERGQ